MVVPLNPYIAGNPVHGQPQFIGRVDVLRDVERMLANPSTNAMVLYGQRRIGKTSVLLQIEQELSVRHHYHPIYFDLHDKTALPLANALYQIAQQIALATGVELPESQQFDRQRNAFRECFIPSAVQAAGDKDLVLLFDEFDVLDSPCHGQAGTAFFPYMQEWMENAKGIQFVFVLGRRPEDLSIETLSAFKAIRSRRVSLMSRKDSLAIIRQSEQNSSLTWSADAVEQLWRWTQGHPFLTQLLCSEVWEICRESAQLRPPAANIEHVDMAVSRTLKEGANQLQWIWNGLPPVERIVVSAIAEADSDIVTKKDVRRLLHRHGIQLLSRELELAPENLSRWDILSPIEHGFCFRIPILRQWVKSEKPVHRVKTEFD